MGRGRVAVHYLNSPDSLQEEWASPSQPYTPYPQPCLEEREGCRLTTRAHWESELQPLAKNKVNPQFLSSSFVTLVIFSL